MESSKNANNGEFSLPKITDVVFKNNRIYCNVPKEDLKGLTDILPFYGKYNSYKVDIFTNQISIIQTSNAQENIPVENVLHRNNQTGCLEYKPNAKNVVNCLLNIFKRALKHLTNQELINSPRTKKLFINAPEEGKLRDHYFVFYLENALVLPAVLDEMLQRPRFAKAMLGRDDQEVANKARKYLKTEFKKNPYYSVSSFRNRVLYGKEPFLFSDVDQILQKKFPMSQGERAIYELEKEIEAGQTELLVLKKYARQEKIDEKVLSPNRTIQEQLEHQINALKNRLLSLEIGELASKNHQNDTNSIDLTNLPNDPSLEEIDRRFTKKLKKEKEGSKRVLKSMQV
jgi:hypothetical protein